MNKSSSMWCQSLTHNGPHLLPAHFTLKWAADSGAILIHLAVKPTTPGVCAAPDPARGCWDWTLALPLALLISLTQRQTPWAWAALQSTCWNPTRMEDSWRKKINFLMFSKRNPRKKSSLEACCACLRCDSGSQSRWGEGRAEQEAQKSLHSPSQALQKVPGLAPGGCGLSDERELHTLAGAIQTLYTSKNVPSFWRIHNNFCHLKKYRRGNITK